MADTTAHEQKRHPIVSFYHASKRYGRRMAVRDVTLHVEHGEFLFLVGASGAGKSTLLRLAYMEEQPTEGQVTVAGFVSSRMRRNRIPQLRRKVGLIFQDFKLLEDRDVFENVAFPLYVTGANRAFIRKTVLDILGRVGLYAKRNSRPLELSGGEQQRVAIARALVNSPFVLLADEPTGNLDPVVANEILKLLFKINIAGTAVIMATHDHETVRRYGQRIVHIEQGELVQDEGAFDRWSRSAQQPIEMPAGARNEEEPTPTLQSRPSHYALPDTPQVLQQPSMPPQAPPVTPGAPATPAAPATPRPPASPGIVPPPASPAPTTSTGPLPPPIVPAPPVMPGSPLAPPPVTPGAPVPPAPPQAPPHAPSRPPEEPES